MVIPSSCRAECRPGPLHCPVLWCLLSLETPLLGHSGTTREREGGRNCPSVPRVPQSPVTSRNKVSASLLRCGVGVRYLRLEPHPACAELQPASRFFLLPAQRAQSKGCCAQMPGAALWSRQDTAGRCSSPQEYPILKAQSNGLPSLRWKGGGLEWWEAVHLRRGEAGLCAKPGVLRWRQLSLTRHN